MKHQVGEVTTSQLRNLLSLTADIYNQLQTHPEETLSEEIRDALTYLRVQFVYAAGREAKVRRFMESANLDAVLKAAPKSRENALLLCRYMEALAAYKKYYDPKEK
jgi:CRISPR-associated protein Csm2